MNASVLLHIPKQWLGGSIYRLVAIAIGAAGVLACALLMILSNRLFSSNISKLAFAMQKVYDGDMDVVSCVRSGDEIQFLSERFNAMTEKIKELMRNIEAANSAEKEAIYRSMESQMRPHFLCNALDFIRMSAEVGGTPAISESIKKIMSYLNYNMNNRQSAVTLREELANVRDFLGIHNLIRRDRIDFMLDISPGMSNELDSCGIIKYTLQPIVENAIKHGFARKESGCFVGIDISGADGEAGGMIAICVEDNGEGMDARRLDALRRAIAAGAPSLKMAAGSDAVAGGRSGAGERGGESLPGDGAPLDGSGPGSRAAHAGIGLANIHARMAMAYQSRFDMRIESYPKVGTRVTLTIPRSPCAPNGGADAQCAWERRTGEESAIGRTGAI
jgi:sensor histidine kinase YesM